MHQANEITAIGAEDPFCFDVGRHWPGASEHRHAVQKACSRKS